MPQLDLGQRIVAHVARQKRTSRTSSISIAQALDLQVDVVRQQLLALVRAGELAIVGLGGLPSIVLA